MKQLLRSFGWSLVLTILAFSYVIGYLGASGTIVLLVLAAIELAFSFDNAVINAKVLGTLSRFWQKLFLSLGIVIAIFVVRLLLPFVIVSLTAHITLGNVVNIAFHQPSIYAQKLNATRLSISSFGGAFLLTLVLRFLTTDRELQWVRIIERPLRRFGRWWQPMLCSLAVVIFIAVLSNNTHSWAIFVAGLTGVFAYVGMNGFIDAMGSILGSNPIPRRVGWTALATFMYLEILDASLSFDGVIGAFAITNQVVLIALGLGVGAIWVRTLTVYMVRHRTLEIYKYLEHGAHYAIGVLALTMLLSAFVTTPDVVPGALCIGIIVAAIVTSREAFEA